MIGFDEAIDIIESAARPLPTERVPLDGAAGRVLAAPIVAGIDSPRADVSAMDGYAVRSGDLTALPAALRIVGESFPGAGWDGTVEPSACVRIFTGAPVPAGADRVVIQEQVRRDGSVAHFAADPGAKGWVRPRGADFRAGEPVLAAGTMLDAATLIAAAGADCAEAEVHGSPRLSLISTGDELVAPGTARASALAVPDSVSLGIAALAEHWGAQSIGRWRLRDDLDSMIPVAREAVETSNLVVVTGGASVGERDYAKAMFEPLGLELMFSKVSIRPGKPAWFGRAGDTLILGLPGNPTSASVTARLFLAPLLALLQGRPLGEALAWEPALLAAPLPPCDQRETFHRATLRAGETTPVDFQESHAQKALAHADVLIRQAANGPGIALGETVQMIRL